jgi:peptidyl-prolyl cis-trans isomerase A (cyclophilin A)
MNDGLYAKLNTNKGAIVLALEFEKTPGTVGNFVALAEGNMENSAKPQGTPYYDGLKFHRVIDNFMVQGGCPQGTGTGNPGYKFEDEFHPYLKHSGPGILSMANSGPGTNGSQFFITHVATDWLDGKHTVFGNVIEGMDVVNAIVQDDLIETVEIIRQGAAANKFNAIEAFRTFEGARAKREANAKAEAAKELAAVTEGFDKTNSGLFYKITKNTDGKPATKGSKVSVHYEGKLLNGQVFDSSFQRNQPIDFNLGIGQVIAGWDEGIQLLKVGEEATFVIPSDLAYGSRGAGGVIPPNAPLIFKVALVSVN